ncbi:MAG TPA: GNAT family N-acetyltransferase [Ignavibacteria bacterium]|nr:GNAT family N-acetyltransferase [Ignavibacteria bacterium]
MIETARLKIFPLTYEQVLKYKDHKIELEKELGINKSNWEHSSEVMEMFEMRLIPRLKKNVDNIIFNSLWLIIDKGNNVIVADIGIKGIPVLNINDNGKSEVEIGYGTKPQFQGKGYMTEAVDGFIKWAIGRTDIDTVLATTEFQNISSIRVLEKNGFEKFDEVENEFCWRKNVC